ncbi:MAG TPA: hypothetical protein VIV60_21950, partial [Polyangiaceae bacterium]
VDARCDIWALGVVLYELLTDRRPYNGDSVLEICATILEASPIRVRDIRPDVPVELETAIMRCLSRDPAARFDSVAAFAQAIAPFSGMSQERLAWTRSQASMSTHASNMATRLADPSAVEDVQTQTEAGLAVAPRRRFSRVQGFTGLLAIALTGMLVAGMLGRVERNESNTESLKVPATNSTAAANATLATSTPTTNDERHTAPLASSDVEMVNQPRPRASQRLTRVSSRSQRSTANVSEMTPTDVSPEPASNAATNALEGDPVLKFGHY